MRIIIMSSKGFCEDEIWCVEFNKLIPFLAYIRTCAQQYLMQFSNVDLCPLLFRDLTEKSLGMGFL